MKLVLRENFDVREDERQALDEYLLVRYETLHYAIPIENVIHVVAMQGASTRWVKAQYAPFVGTVEWDGRHVPILDLFSHLETATGQDSPEVVDRYAQSGTVVFVNWKGSVYGLRVESVLRLIRMSTSNENRFPAELLRSARKPYESISMAPEGVVVGLRLSAVLPTSLADYLAQTIEELQDSSKEATA